MSSKGRCSTIGEGGGGSSELLIPVPRLEGTRGRAVLAGVKRTAC